MTKPRIIGTILANGRCGTIENPVLTVGAGLYSNRCPVSCPLNRTPCGGNTRNDGHGKVTTRGDQDCFAKFARNDRGGRLLRRAQDAPFGGLRMHPSMGRTLRRPSMNSGFSSGRRSGCFVERGLSAGCIVRLSYRAASFYRPFDELRAGLRVQLRVLEGLGSGR